MGEVVSERGLGAATVATVVARAGVSRRTFYELFADREACFLAAFDHAIALACAAVLPEFERAQGWRERLRGGLAALLGFLDEQPDLGALCVVHSLGAGPLSLKRRGDIIDVLIAVVDEGRMAVARGARKGAPLAPLTAEGVVGAVLAVIHARLVARSSEPMVGLLGSLMNMIVLPYLGTAAANRELLRPVPPSQARPRRAARDPLKDIDMRLTYRTVRVLIAIATWPGGSNRHVGDAAGIADQGQISKLLQRLTSLGLIQNTGAGHARGEANAWQLTPKGEEVERTIRAEAAPSASR
jgi:AcrR family transcriptional regulator